MEAAKVNGVEPPTIQESVLLLGPTLDDSINRGSHVIGLIDEVNSDTLCAVNENAHRINVIVVDLRCYNMRFLTTVVSKLPFMIKIYKNFAKN